MLVMGLTLSHRTFGCMAVILLSALGFVLGYDVPMVRSIAMFTMLGGVLLLWLNGSRARRAQAAAGGTESARSPRPILGMLLGAATIASFGWLWFSGDIGQPPGPGLWIYVSATVILLIYLFYYFIIRRPS